MRVKRPSRHLLLYNAVPLIIIAHLIMQYDSAMWYSSLTTRSTQVIPTVRRIDSSKSQSLNQLFNLVTMSLRDAAEGENNKKGSAVSSMNDSSDMNQKAAKKSAPANEYVSACLFLRDEDKSRQALVEWLAYHYHTLPLRYLIVAVHNNNHHNNHATVSWSDIFDRYRRHSSLLNMTILGWTNEDYLTKPIVHKYGPPPTNVTQQEQEGTFYYRCLQGIQEHHREESSISAWTWLAHVNENLAWNPQPLPHGGQHQDAEMNFTRSNVIKPVSLLQTLKELESQRRRQHADLKGITALEKKVISSFSLSPCLPMNRYRLGASATLPSLVIPTILLGNRTTFASARHVFFDVTRISQATIVPPIHSNRNLCDNHSGRADKISSTARKHANQSNINDGYADHDGEIRNGDGELLPPATTALKHLWLPIFIQSVGRKVARDLLQNHDATVSLSRRLVLGDRDEGLPERCAMLFFGLPRAYGSLVLPSIIKNLLIPNARHNCDVFVHYYRLTAEPSGRKNNGGTIDPTAILKLRQATQMVSQYYHHPNDSGKEHTRIPHVTFTHDTDESFWYLRNTTVQKYRNTKDKEGRLLYFPFNEESYEFPSSLDNIVKQWHSIESVWNLMDKAIRQGIANYTRVGLFRSDVMYVTPIDMYRTSLDDPDDHEDGRYAIVPPFALYPVNDRMVYGSFDALKIWATKRFEYIEDHVRNHPWGPGYGMHSESFLKSYLFPAIKQQTGVNVTMNPDICFFRTRADESIMISDCEVKGETRDILAMNKEQVITNISGLTNCTTYSMGAPFEAMTCSRKLI